MPAARFDVIHPRIASCQVRSLWRGEGIDSEYTHISVLTDTIGVLIELLGSPGPSVQAYADTAAFIKSLGADTTFGVPGTVQERMRDIPAKAP